MNGVFTITAFAWRQRTRGFRLLAPLAVALLPSLVLLLGLTFGHDPKPLELYRRFLVPVSLYFVLPFVTMFVMLPILQELYGKGAIGYLFTRPVPRWQPLLGLFLGGWLATLPAFFAAVIIPAAMCLAVDRAGGDTAVITTTTDVWIKTVLGLFSVLSLAGLAYGALCLLFGVWSKKPILWSFLALFIWGVLFGTLPGDGQMWSLHYYLFGLARAWCGITDIWTGMFPPVANPPSVPVSLIGLGVVMVSSFLLATVAARRRDIL